MNDYTRNPWNCLKHAKKQKRGAKALIPEKQFEANCEWRKCPKCHWRKLFRKGSPETYLQILPAASMMDNWLIFRVWYLEGGDWAGLVWTNRDSKLIALAVNRLDPDTLKPIGPNPELRRYHWHPEPPV